VTSFGLFSEQAAVSLIILADIFAGIGGLKRD